MKGHLVTQHCQVGVCHIILLPMILVSFSLYDKIICIVLIVILWLIDVMTHNNKAGGMAERKNNISYVSN